MKRITKIDAAAKETKKLRVAAYARVSTDSADQLVSLDAQKEHYEQSKTAPTGSSPDSITTKGSPAQRWPSATACSVCLPTANEVLSTTSL